MGKHDAFSPKAIANRIKAKGLQKLRWYCQLCQKQCRDENGFKCHLTSEGHLRQMRVFGENPDKVINEYSQQFEDEFLKMLAGRHSTKRVAANVVYQEMIADKHHVHMNSTQWVTLTAFVKYLGKTGKCVVDETEKGWFVQYIDRDPVKLAKLAAAEKRKRAELDEGERQAQLIASQIEAANKLQAEREGEGSSEGDAPTALQRENEEEKVTLALKPVAETNGAAKRLRPAGNVFQSLSNGSAAEGKSVAKSAAKTNGVPRGLGALDALMRENEERKQRELEAEERKNRFEYWLHVNIVVKVMNKRLADGKYYKKKGIVQQVIDRYIAEVQMLDSGDVIRIDQEQLETTIPQPGNVVLIVNGRGRGSRANLLAINEDKYNCTVRIEEGSLAGREIEVDYEDLCKLDLTAASARRS